MKRKFIKNNNLLKNTLWKMDWVNEQLIIYEKNCIYFIPYRSYTAMKLDTSKFPEDVKKFILKNIIVNNKLAKINKTYNTKVSNDNILRFPTLHYILMFTLKVIKNPFDIYKQISVFRYDENNSLDLNLNKKINYIFENYK